MLGTCPAARPPSSDIPERWRRRPTERQCRDRCADRPAIAPSETERRWSSRRSRPRASRRAAKPPDFLTPSPRGTFLNTGAPEIPVILERCVMIRSMRLLLATIFVAAASPVALAFGSWSGSQTPSGNIVCNGSGSEIDCVVFSASPTCQRTWPLRRVGRASLHCYYANIGTEVPVLSYGHAVSRSGMRCVSRRSGLTCINTAGHGFFLSRESQRMF
jgi:hypothetical protein